MFRRIFSFIFLLCFLLQICTACTLNLPEATPVVGDVSNEQIDTIYPEWTASEIYTIGQIVIHEGKYFRVLWWTRGNPPKPDIAYDEWQYLGNVPLKETMYYYDVHNSTWYANAINTLASADIFEDTNTESNFFPSRPATRGFFAVILCHALHIAPVYSGPNFSDAGDTWYTPYLAALKQKGLATGTPDNRFEPDRHLTRQELCKLIYDACDGFAEDPVAAFAPYIDADTVDTWAIQPMSWCIERSILRNDEPRLLPDEILSRADAAQSIYNLLYRPQ